MTDLLQRPRRLERGDDRSTFHSGAPELDDWFRRFAWKNQRAGNAVAYVTTLGDRVVGYYALAAADVRRDEVPPEFGARRPQSIPCVLLARLAVDESAQGRGVGAALFRDAISRAVSVSHGLGAACLLVHCRDTVAKGFYLRLADLLESPLDPMQLVLPMKVAKRMGRPFEV